MSLDAFCWYTAVCINDWSNKTMSFICLEEAKLYVLNQIKMSDYNTDYIIISMGNFDREIKDKIRTLRPLFLM
jgi:hypothetical protein